MSMNLTMERLQFEAEKENEMDQWINGLNHHGSLMRQKDIATGICLLHNPSTWRNQAIQSLIDTMSIDWSSYRCEVVFTVLCECFNTDHDVSLYDHLVKTIRNAQARRTIHDLFQLPLWLHLLDQWDRMMMEG